MTFNEFSDKLEATLDAQLVEYKHISIEVSQWIWCDQGKKQRRPMIYKVVVYKDNSPIYHVEGDHPTEVLLMLLGKIQAREEKQTDIELPH